jgi:hypothetical protein
MNLQFRLPDAVEDSDLGQLHDWLVRDRVLRTGARVSEVSAPPGPESMGLSLEAVELVLNAGLQLASLAVAIVSWRKAAGPRSGMTVTRDGVEVRLSSTDLEDLHTVLAALESLRETGEDAGAPSADRDRGGGGGGPQDPGEGAGDGAL